MHFFILTILNTLLLLLLLTIVIAIITFLKNKSISKKLDDSTYALKWKFRKITGYLAQIIVPLSLFIHFFIIVFFVKENNGIMALHWGIGKFLGYLLVSLFIGLFFLLSVPKLISFCQFLVFEYKRIVVYNPKEKSLIIFFYNNDKYLFKDGDFETIEFSLQRQFSYRDIDTIDYVKITTKQKTAIVFTSLLIDILPSFELQSMCKGIQRQIRKKTFNLIENDHTTII